MSEKDCRNDCALPLRFPRRPGTDFFVRDGDDCFCCEGGHKTSADNRPALPHFNYRIGSYGSIREFLLHGINNSPALRAWTHREPDDPAIALLEGAAILGDILTFYQETYANEAFLRTAQWRESVADLVRLLGYRLSPALGGSATFAFELKKDEAVTIPAGFPLKATLEELEKPADFETTEEITAYPWLSRFNLYRPLTAPSVGGTTNEFYISGAGIEIKAGDRLLVGDEESAQSGLPVKLANAEMVIVDAVRELHGIKLIKIKGSMQKRAGGVSQIKAFKLGRTFHHFGYNGPKSFSRTPNPVESTATVANGTTTVTTNIEEVFINFTRFLNKATSSNSVGESTLLDDMIALHPYYSNSYANYSNLGSYSGGSSGYQYQQQAMKVSPVGSGGGAIAQVEEVDLTAFFFYTERIVSPSLAADEFPLDAEVQDMAAGAPFIVQIDSGNLTIIRRIKNIRTESMTWGQMTGSASILKLESLESLLGSTKSADIRKMLFHEVLGEPVTLKASFIEFSPAPVNQVLTFYGTAEQAENLRGRRIMFGEQARVVSVTNITTPYWDLPEMHFIEISEEINYADFPQENPTVTVYGNLAEANEGKTQAEVPLGNGDNTTIFQTFKLPKAPLTYHLNTASTPPETPELEIYVNGRLWQKVETFFDRGAEEEIYIVREDGDGNSWAQFGDGKTGARLPTGVKNVSAIYRTGAGAFGALKADTKVQAGAKLKNLDKIQMPQVASGGTEAESGDNAKSAAPGKVQSLDRLVSLRDYENETAAMPGVSLASAAWSLVDNIPTVVVTVLMETGRGGEITAIEDTLKGYNSGRGAARFPIKTVAGSRLYVYTAAEYALDGAFRADLVEPEIRRALGVNFGKATGKEDQTGLFSLRKRAFRKNEYASTIEGKIQSVAGVVWARVTAFASLSAFINDDNQDKPEEITPTGTIALNDKVVCGDSQVLSLFDEHLFLTKTA